MVPTNTPRADALVMLGITGDLGEQKLLPALAQLSAAGLLDVPVVGVGRSERSDGELRQMLVDAVDGDVSGIDRIDLMYVSGDASDAATFDAVAKRLGDGVELPVVYASLPPQAFGAVAAAVAASALPQTTRLVVEKPFGDDADDARRLHDEITCQIGDERLFVVDHFLAKSSVENLLTFRCANPVIDALMCGCHVDRIEVTMSEAFGVEGRESFYDSVGAVADVVQNHLLQLIAVLTMEPPDDDSAEAFDRARAALLRDIPPLSPSDVVLGQFDGYTDHDDIDDDSTTETFAAARLSIDNERWAGTPVYVRTGKQMTVTATEATVVFRSARDADGSARPNRIRFGIKPVATIAIELVVLDTDDDAHGTRPVQLVACAPGDHGSLGDYATMLDGAMAGEHRHFARIDGIVAAWRIVDPIRAARIRPERYAIGSMGPTAADRFPSPDGWVPLRA